LAKSEDSLISPDLLLENGSTPGGINRMYYAVYHVISALSVQDGIVTKSHKELKAKFGEAYV
jgi:uncharacterized protein (UPF0332 family)